MVVLDWKWGIIWVLTASVGVGQLAACAPPQSPPAAAYSQAPTFRTEPATMGDISVKKTYATLVEAKNQVDMVPIGAGRIEKLTVSVGSEVKKGQIMAELSHGTLDAQLQQSEATLRKAQARLASVQAVATPNRIKAQARLDASRAKLDQLLNPAALDLQSAQSAVDKAQANLDSRKTNLDQLLHPTASDLTVGQAKVAEAQSELSTAQVKVDQAISNETSAPGLGEYSVDPNPATLDTALANLSLLKNPTPADLAVVESQLVQTLTLYKGFPSGKTVEASAALWGMVLIARQGLEANATTLSYPALSSALTPAESAMVQQIVTAYQVVISTLLVQISSHSLFPEGIRTAMALESEALVALEAAKAKLKGLQNPGKNTIALAEYAVDEAEALLDAALAELSLSKNPNSAKLAAAEAEVAIDEQVLALNQNPYLQQTILAAKAEVDEAQAEVNLFKQQLAELQLRAPFDGFVTQVWLSPGAMASSRPSTPVVTVVSKDVVISFLVEETSIGSLRKGQIVNFTSPALAAQQLDLRIDRIAPAGDQRAHTFEVQMHPLDLTLDLKPGMSGQVSISTRRENVLLVPKGAVLSRGGQPALFLVQDGMAHFRKVGGGLTDGKNMEIHYGIQPGDLVLVSGQHLLDEGSSIILEAP
jgi:RND family efflux transporter MFP subunit